LATVIDFNEPSQYDVLKRESMQLLTDIKSELSPKTKATKGFYFLGLEGETFPQLSYMKILSLCVSIQKRVQNKVV